jgi:hypothetical protein
MNRIRPGQSFLRMLVADGIKQARVLHQKTKRIILFSGFSTVTTWQKSGVCGEKKMNNWGDIFRDSLEIGLEEKLYERRRLVIDSVVLVVNEMSQAVNEIDRNMSLTLVRYGKNESFGIIVARLGVAVDSVVSVQLDKVDGWPFHIMSAGSTRTKDVEEFTAFLSKLAHDKESKLIKMLKSTLLPPKEAESTRFSLPRSKDVVKRLEAKRTEQLPSPIADEDAPHVGPADADGF